MKEACPIYFPSEERESTSPIGEYCVRAIAARKSSYGDRYPTSKIRICNSDDYADGGCTENCLTADLPYTEVRIIPGNWDSTIMVSRNTSSISIRKSCSYHVGEMS